MPFFKFKKIKISAVASAVPKQVINVAEFSDSFGAESVKQFSEKTGIYEYRKSLEHQTASDLSFVAAEKILTEKDIDRNEVGALVFVSHSTDYRRPATACVLHRRLGLSKNCAAFDIGLGCSAFVYGLQTVCSMMQNSDINKALLLVGETLTKWVNPKDKSTVMLFGDGGGAVLLEKTDEEDEICGLLRTDGNGYRSIIAPAGGFRNLNAPTEDMVWKDGNIRSLYNANMNGVDVFAFTISDVPRTVKDFLSKTCTTVDDYDCLAFHQANKFIQQMVAKKLKADLSKMPLCLDRYGNTSAAAIPLTICDRYGNDNENTDVKFLMCGFGVGLSWGVVSAQINTQDIYPVIETDEIFKEGIINSPDDL